MLKPPSFLLTTICALTGMTGACAAESFYKSPHGLFSTRPDEKKSLQSVDRFGPVGEPPITEWVYGSFRVYFEHEIVLHSIDLNTIIMPKQ